MTPLGRIIEARIQRDGPMRLDEYMRLCLLHPQHGYYATRDPFGAKGDFTTAPEISQMFGEMIGLALAQSWLDQGAPSPFTLAEIGPGRGTLMADILRATARVPGFRDAAQVTLVEASPHLRRIQRETLGEIIHLDHAAQLPDARLFIVANEFFDALPIRQMQRVPGGWAERMVTRRDGELALSLDAPVDLPRRGEIGEVWETCPEALPIVTEIARRIAAHRGAAIFIDYGNWDGKGDSLQALRAHASEGIFANPGEADLTAHVDFAPLAATAMQAGAAASQMIGQGAWLLSLGIAERAKRLAAAGDQGAMAALERLTADDAMGQLFKALAIYPRDSAVPPGFSPLMTRSPAVNDVSR